VEAAGAVRMESMPRRNSIDGSPGQRNRWLLLDRYGQVTERRDELAFVALNSCPRAQHEARLGQIVDMPTYWLNTTHVATDTSPKAPWPFRRTTIKIATCFERYWKPVGQLCT
jgi:hypothetical protein